MVATMGPDMSSWMGSDWGYDGWDGYGYDEGSGSMGSACGSSCGGCGACGGCSGSGGCGGGGCAPPTPGTNQSAPSRPPGPNCAVVHSIPIGGKHSFKFLFGMSHKFGMYFNVFYGKILRTFGLLRSHCVPYGNMDVHSQTTSG